MFLIGSSKDFLSVRSWTADFRAGYCGLLGPARSGAFKISNLHWSFWSFCRELALIDGNILLVSAHSNETLLVQNPVSEERETDPDIKWELEILYFNGSNHAA